MHTYTYTQVYARGDYREYHSLIVNKLVPYHHAIVLL